MHSALTSTYSLSFSLLLLYPVHAWCSICRKPHCQANSTHRTCFHRRKILKSPANLPLNSSFKISIVVCFLFYAHSLFIFLINYKSHVKKIHNANVTTSPRLDSFSTKILHKYMYIIIIQQDANVARLSTINGSPLP